MLLTTFGRFAPRLGATSYHDSRLTGALLCIVYFISVPGLGATFLDIVHTRTLVGCYFAFCTARAYPAWVLLCIIYLVPRLGATLYHISYPAWVLLCITYFMNAHLGA